MIIDLHKIKWLLCCLLVAVVVIMVLYHSSWFWRAFYPLHHRELIFYYAAQYGVDPYLVAAVIRVESKFYAEAESNAGARGLMQVMPETGMWVADIIGLDDFNADQLYDPEVNICIGTWYLANLSQEFDDLVLVLAAYNGGRGNVKRWLEIKEAQGEALTRDNLPFPETRSFVEKVLYNYQRYQEIYLNKW
ncbi:MAG: lytic transglycosylase domain-containing protein [bacterium]|jgi:soluble lytic murein transglycosylase